MNSNDLKDLVGMLKRQIDKGASIDDIKTSVMKNQSESIYIQIEKEVVDYIVYKTELLEKNKPYWMLICNPKLWGEGTSEHEVNDLLIELPNINDKDSDYESWKINANTSMELQMKEGQRGILKVSDDKRSKYDRTDEDGNLVDTLEAGIYGIFEIVKDENGKCTFKDEYGDWFVNIKMVENFYHDGINIPKDISRDLLGESVYNSIPSRKIDKVLFDNVINHIAKVRG